MSKLMSEFKTATLMLLAMTFITGFAYPLLVTGAAQVIFPKAANGSLIEENGHVVGSDLIGQPFDDSRYFWSRPSATLTTAGDGPLPYNAAASCGSNLAVTNPAQADAVRERVAKLRASGVAADQPIPVDLITASGSGLDPHISVAAAQVQIARVARARGLREDAIAALVRGQTEDRQLGVLGAPRINVLRLNLALDRESAGARPASSPSPVNP